MTLKKKTFGVVFSLSLILFFFSILFFIYNSNFDYGNHSIESRFFMSRWMEKHFFPAVFEDRLDSFIVPEGIDLFLIDFNNIVIFSNIDGLSKGDNFQKKAPLFLEIIKTAHVRTMAESFFLNGENTFVFAFYSELPRELEKYKFFPIARFFYYTLIVIIIGVVQGFFFFGSLLKSVKKLETAAKRIADWDLDFSLKVEGNDEFASLTAAFEKMRQALKESLARQYRFLMSISHDLKTPLTSIKGYLEAINDGIADNPETRKKYLKIISDKADILEERITDLLSFASITSDELRGKRVKIKLESFLNKLFFVYKEDCEILDKKFESVNTIPTDYELLCNPVLFERALENIFTNALRYTSENALITARGYMKNGIPFIEFEDNGIGIKKKDLNKIFEPFFRGSASRREHGMGLGLATSKSLFEDLGWEMEVLSEEGKGSLFRVFFTG